MKHWMLMIYPQLVEPISQTSGVDVLVQGLCALLFGVCYHFNREPGEITRFVLYLLNVLFINVDNIGRPSIQLSLDWVPII